MKKIFLLLTVCFIFTNLKAQKYSLNSFYRETQYYIDIIENQYMGQIVRVEFDITTGVSNTYRYLAKGQVYSLMVLADTNKISNIDIKVYQNQGNQWKLIAQDTKTEKMALLNFEPKTSDIYKFEIIANLKPNEKFGFYSFLIFR